MKGKTRENPNKNQDLVFVFQAGEERDNIGKPFRLWEGGDDMWCAPATSTINLAIPPSGACLNTKGNAVMDDLSIGRSTASPVQ